MTVKRFFGWLLKVPLILLILGSVGASWYLFATKQYDITMATAVILTIILIAFILGDYILSKEEANENQ